MKIERSIMPEIMLLSPEVFTDRRGFFMETWNRRIFEEIGIGPDFFQDNLSGSSYLTLRGIHYQLKHPQGKLIRVAYGEVFDVAVDLRSWSRNFGRWTGFHLKACNKQILWIPPGFGHGFLTLSETAEVNYKCSAYYNPESEQCIIWNDEQLAIEWPIPEGLSPVLSEKDTRGKTLEESEIFTSPSQLSQ